MAAPCPGILQMANIESIPHLSLHRRCLFELVYQCSVLGVYLGTALWWLFGMLLVCSGQMILWRTRVAGGCLLAVTDLSD